MPGMLSRLYAYRERPSVSPLENFLTEVFAELFERLPPDLKRSLLDMLLPAAARSALGTISLEPGRLSARTQVSAHSPGSSTRPDLIVQVDGRDLVVVEVKLGAGIQQHEDRDEAPDAAAEGRVVRNQLETYARWIARATDRGDGWGGAVVLLTAYTDPPDDFVDGRADGVSRATRRWKDVGDWILDQVPIGHRETTHCALAAELHHFLQERDLMTKYISARDIAVGTLFANSDDAFYETFMEVLGAIGKHAPKLRGARRYNAEFWGEANIYWGWFYFAQSVKRSTSKPYVAVGICFEVAASRIADAPRLPRNEPFFFVSCCDDWEDEKPTAFLESIPEGWVEVEEDWMIMAARPVRSFTADPDGRVEELKAWAIAEIDKLVACVPGYASAKTEAEPAEEEVEA